MFKKYNIDLSERKNLVMINGKDKSSEYIVDEYISHFRNGYDLTVDEIVNNLGVSKDYFQKKLSNEIEHIIITSTIRPKLIRNENADSEFEHLYYKRVIYNRDSYKSMIKRLMEKECRAITINIANIEEISEFVFSNCIEIQEYIDSFNNTIPPIFKSCDLEMELPEKFTRMSKINESNSFNYNIQGYRYVNSLYLSKYKLHKNVRYNIEEFVNENERLFVAYSFLEYFMVGDDNIEVIINTIEKAYKRYLEKISKG